MSKFILTFCSVLFLSTSAFAFDHECYTKNGKYFFIKVNTAEYGNTSRDEDGVFGEDAPLKVWNNVRIEKQLPYGVDIGTIYLLNAKGLSGSLTYLVEVAHISSGGKPTVIGTGEVALTDESGKKINLKLSCFPVNNGR